MAVDANETRRQRVLDALADGATRTWSRTVGANTYNFTVANPQIRVLNGSRVLTVDVTVTRNGTAVYDDRINMPNPSIGQRDASGNFVDNPLAGLRDQLFDTVRVVLRDGPHLQRNANGTFRGDTLSVRAGTADGYIDTGTSTTWSTVQGGGTSPTATTGLAQGFITAQKSGSNFRILETFVGFDTSSLGAGATISAYTLTFYGDGTAESDANGYTAQARVFDWGASLTTADFVTGANWTSNTLFADFDVTGWVQTNNTANDFTSQGASASINKTGTTDLVVGMSGVSGAAPTGLNNIETYLADNTGTSSDPLLTITYSVAVSGTIAASLQKATFSGTGAQTQTGTIAATLQKALFTGSGAQAQTGTIAATLQAATFSGSGTSGASPEGTIASTMQAASFSGSGVMQPSGTMAATMQSATFAGAGAQAQTGSMAATMQPATFAATAEQIMSGAMVGTLQQTTFTGAGLQTQTGTIAATLTKATFAGAGYMLPEGSIAATMQPATFAGAGQHIQTGTMAATLQSLIFSGAGGQTQTGTMAATLQVLTFIGIALMQWPDASGTISDARAYSATLADAYANSGILSDARYRGGTLDDADAYGGVLTDARTYGGTISDG